MFLKSMDDWEDWKIGRAKEAMKFELDGKKYTIPAGTIVFIDFDGRPIVVVMGVMLFVDEYEVLPCPVQ